jgi:hypothetical protein
MCEVAIDRGRNSPNGNPPGRAKVPAPPPRRPGGKRTQVHQGDGHTVSGHRRHEGRPAAGGKARRTPGCEQGRWGWKVASVAMLIGSASRAGAPACCD